MRALDLHVPPGDTEALYHVAHDLVLRRELGVAGASLDTVMAIAIRLTRWSTILPPDVLAEADRLEVVHAATPHLVSEDEAYALLASMTAVFGRHLAQR